MELKECAVCDEEFTPKYYNQTLCVKAECKREASLRRNAKYYRKNKFDLLKEQVKKYGITVEDFNKMLEEQGGVCAICKSNCNINRRLCIDHCHTTGKVRGLLCSECNSGIGKLKDDKELLKSALAYLEERG